MLLLAICATGCINSKEIHQSNDSVSKVSISKDKIQPNILLIVTDDAGYSDFGFSGTKNFATPHINKLANTGVVFD